MVLLGVILVIIAVAAGVVLFAGTAQLTDTVDIGVLGGTLSLPPLTLLVTGMIVISLFWLGWALLRGGLRRGKRRRLEAKEAAAAAEARRVEEERRLKAEFAARERELLDERQRQDQVTGTARVADTRTDPAAASVDHRNDPAGTRVDRSEEGGADRGRSTPGPV